MKIKQYIPLVSAYILLSSSFVGHCQEPPLPTGLDGGDQATENNKAPALPEGLQPTESDEEPALPAGLGDDGEEESNTFFSSEDKDQGGYPAHLTGFIDLRGGVRTQSDPYEPEASLGELRLQVEGEKTWNSTVAHARLDFVYDTIVLSQDIRLNDGRGWLDLREASVLLRPFSFADIEIGRQILTWGVGDLLFINDLFPKDWNSFFLGRAVEYLKAPSDAVKASLYTDFFNINAVYTPQFDPDRYIDGRVVSYYNSAMGKPAGRNALVRADIPDRWLEEDELAVRIYNRIGSFETALYGYWGYWKSPAGSDRESGKAIFPELHVYGTSLRGPMLGGIGRAEAGWYNSHGDPNGDDPLVRNSELRLLVGHERELARNFTGALQYYLEYILDYDEYTRTLPPNIPVRDRDRHILTLRLTRLLMSQNLELSLFAFYSPTDEDAYLRPHAEYKIDDQWTVGCGANLFIGRENHTFFGQFENNSNVYASVRYSY